MGMDVIGVILTASCRLTSKIVRKKTSVYNQTDWLPLKALNYHLFLQNNNILGVKNRSHAAQ
jgi:hypothetical protein